MQLTYCSLTDHKTPQSLEFLWSTRSDTRNLKLHHTRIKLALCRGTTNYTRWTVRNGSLGDAGSQYLSRCIGDGGYRYSKTYACGEETKLTKVHGLNIIGNSLVGRSVGGGGVDGVDVGAHNSTVF